MANSINIALSANLLANRNGQSKRPLNVDQWQDIRNKRLRQAGQPYESRSGQFHPAVEQVDVQFSCGPKCTRPGCQLPEERCFELFNEYWSSASYDVQTSILLRLIRRTCVEKRTRDIDTSRRKATYKYFLLSTEGMELQVCKTKFMRTFAITYGRIEILQSKMESGRLYFSDNRGRHDNRPHRFSENVREAMGEHIASYPTYMSHYQREHGDPGRLYLNPDLTISQMFKGFVAVYGEQGADSWEWAYRQIIKARNLRIGNPKTDTCSKCDELILKIQHLEKTGDFVNDRTTREALEDLYTEQVEHHANAEDGYQAMRADKERSRADHTYITLSVDLQGVLFSPVLTNPEYYYLRKFSTHNLAIVELATDVATMCIWHCTEGNKGSSEVGSCLLRYCQAKFQPLQQHEQRTLVVWSDRSGGQNNNKYMVMLYRYLIAMGLFTTIHQKFLTTGHTFLAADRQFALIEKEKKGERINVPDDWLQIIMKANTESPSNLQKMNYDDFKRISDLEAYFRLPNTLKISQIKWIRLERESPNLIYTKEEISTTDFAEHNVVNPRCMVGLLLQNQYNDFIPLAAPLVKDLKTLIRWVPEEHHTSWSFLNEYD